MRSATAPSCASALHCHRYKLAGQIKLMTRIGGARLNIAEGHVWPAGLVIDTCNVADGALCHLKSTVLNRGQMLKHMFTCLNKRFNNVILSRDSHICFYKRSCSLVIVATINQAPYPMGSQE